MRASPSDVLDLLDVMGALLEARTVRFHVADYAIRTLQHIDANGPAGEPQSIAGTLIGRVFASGETHVVPGTHPAVLLVPLIEGSSRIGVLELEFDDWDGVVPELLDPLAAVFVMSWIVKARYTDVAARARPCRTAVGRSGTCSRR